MSEKIVDYEKSAILLISAGEYSDYGINGVFRVLKGFNANDELLSWAKETGRVAVNGVIQSDFANKEIKYVGWLSKCGFIEDIDHRELHVGDYGDTELCDYSCE